jgi:hypothetical protein
MRIHFISFVLVFTITWVLLATPVKGQLVTTEKVTFGLQGQSLEQAFTQLQAKTSFIFYYRKADVRAFDHLSLPYATRTLAATLQALLENTSLVFRQEGSNIFIERNQSTAYYQVNGRLVDSHRMGLPFAAVRLTKVNSDQTIQSVQTDTGGYFRLSVTERGEYLLHLTATGKDSQLVALALTDKPVITLPDLLLSDAYRTLKEVVISGKKPFIEQKIDRIVVNVDALISNTGANALEVLQNSPGVLVDANGNISFEGKPGVLILIDGKPTYLSGDNLANYLKSLPASVLDQIELMDNPPAKYDAQGNAGVINIKTKKNRAEGFNGLVAASYGYGRYGQSNESLNLNYHKGPVNLFAGAAYGLRQGWRELDLGRDYFNPSGSLNSIFSQVQYIETKNYSTNLKLGMDYDLSKATTWGMVLTGTLANGRSANPATDRLYDSLGNLDSLVQAQNAGKSHFDNGGINLNYSHRFDSLGKTITVDLDYLTYDAGGDHDFYNQTFLPDGALVGTQQITDLLPVHIRIYSGKTDLIRPMGGKVTLQTGLKSSYVTTDNQAGYYDVANGVSTVDDNFSNQFLYRENINAAYLNGNKSFKRLEVQAGLRVENTNVFGHQLGNATHPDSAFTQHYTDLFPTAYLSYKLDSAGRHLFTGSYGRRIGRPFYQDLNPFILPSDKFTWSEGNPFLRPQFSDNYKLSYSDGSFFIGSLFYNHVSDLQNEVIRQQGNIFIDGKGNIGHADFIGATANLSVEPVRWWSLNTYLQLIHNHFRGQLYASYLNSASTYGQVNMTSQFTLGNRWVLEISGFYVSKFADGQSVVDGFGQLNGGIQKKVLHNKGTLKFSGQDLLHTYVSKGTTSFIGDATSTFRNRFNSQIFTLGVSYNFGTAGTAKKRRDTGSAGSESERVKK